VFRGAALFHADERWPSLLRRKQAADCSWRSAAERPATFVCLPPRRGA